MRIDVLTLFPEMFRGFLEESVLAKAIDRGLIRVVLHNIRAWSHDPKHHKVDDRPFGGGPGMVLMAPPVVECVEAVQAQAEAGHLVLLTPQGRRLTQEVVEELSRYPRLLLLCGRYEGFDERVRLILRPDEISIGDYVLSGGEVPAMAVIEAVSRLIPGVLGDEESCRRDSFSGPDRLLDHAQYTRPRGYRGHEVPAVLLSGNHTAVARWRLQDSRARTESRRATSARDASAAESIGTTDMTDMTGATKITEITDATDMPGGTDMTRMTDMVNTINTTDITAAGDTAKYGGTKANGESRAGNGE